MAIYEWQINLNHKDIIFKECMISTSVSLAVPYFTLTLCILIDSSFWLDLKKKSWDSPLYISRGVRL